MDIQKFYEISKFFDLVTKLFKSDLLHIKYVINAFKFYLYQLTQYKKKSDYAQASKCIKNFS